MTRLDHAAFSQAYTAAAGAAQEHLDAITFAAGAIAGLAEHGASDRAPEAERARDQAVEQLRQLRLAVDDVDHVLAEHLYGGPHGGPRQCPVSEVRPRGMARCLLEEDHPGDHRFPT